MTARHEHTDTAGIWAQLAAPLPPDAIQWRQDGKPSERQGKYFARFVAYIDAHFVRERLDAVVPGNWDLTLEPLPPTGTGEADSLCNFKGRLSVLGVLRECVGSGPDYKQAATDAFKRAAVRFGIGHELYAFGPNWVQVDGDGKYAKPLEDPAAAYARKAETPSPDPRSERRADVASRNVAAVDADNQRKVENAVTGAGPDGDVACPKCGGKTWDNRATKRNPKAPDFKCRDRSCDGVIWPPKASGNGKGEKHPVSIGEVPGLDDDDDDDGPTPF